MTDAPIRDRSLTSHRGKGFEAILERRKGFEEEDGEHRPRPANPVGAKLAVDPSAIASLESVLALWKRSEEHAPGTATGDDAENGMTDERYDFIPFGDKARAGDEIQNRRPDKPEREGAAAA